MRVTFNQFARLIYPLGIMFSTFSLTDTAAVLEVVFETDTYLLFLDGIGCNRDITGSNRVELMNQFKDSIYRIAETIRSVVLTGFLVDGTSLEYPRERLSCDTDTGITLSVFEQDVIVRLILLNEVVFEQEGILLALYYYVSNISYIGD